MQSRMGGPMSVEFGGGSSGDDRMAEALRNAGHHVFAHLYETYAARLFDYCVGLLADEVAATVAVQDGLIAVDSKIGKLPDPDRLRVQLYWTARRQCLSRLPRRRADAPPSSKATTLVEFIAEQAYPAADEAEATSADTQVAIAALARLAGSDREVLNLAFRHGIEGADLALVLGVSPRRARAMLSDAGTRFRKSAAIVVALRGGLAACDPLEAIAYTGDRAAQPLTPERRARRRPERRARGARRGADGDPAAHAPAAAHQDGACPRQVPPRERAGGLRPGRRRRSGPPSGRARPAARRGRVIAGPRHPGRAGRPALQAHVGAGPGRGCRADGRRAPGHPVRLRAGLAGTCRVRT